MKMVYRSMSSSSIKLPITFVHWGLYIIILFITLFDTFPSLVHKNPAFDDMTRFHYQRFSLKELLLKSSI